MRGPPETPSYDFPTWHCGYDIYRIYHINSLHIYKGVFAMTARAEFGGGGLPIMEPPTPHNYLYLRALTHFSSSLAQISPLAQPAKTGLVFGVQLSPTPVSNQTNALSINNLRGSTKTLHHPPTPDFIKYKVKFNTMIFILA